MAIGEQKPALEFPQRFINEANRLHVDGNETVFTALASPHTKCEVGFTEIGPFQVSHLVATKTGPVQRGYDRLVAKACRCFTACCKQCFNFLRGTYTFSRRVLQTLVGW